MASDDYLHVRWVGDIHPLCDRIGYAKRCLVAFEGEITDWDDVCPDCRRIAEGKGDE